MDATACIESVYLFQSKLVKTNYLNNLLFVLWLGSAIRGWVGGCFCICSWQKSLSCWNAVEMRESDEREWRGGANSRCCCQERKWKGRGPPLTKPGEMEESPNKNTYNGGIANKEIHPPWAPTVVVFHWSNVVFKQLASNTFRFLGCLTLPSPSTGSISAVSE